jgi:uncharacterized protein YndB with AHSA1/START domain
VTTEQPSLVGDREIVIERVVDAPRDLVWQAWTQIEHLERWWGQDGVTTTTREFEMRPDGVWRLVMHTPDGVDHRIRLVFREVTPPERLTYVHDDEGAGQVPEFPTTVTFEDLGERGTPVSMRSLFASKAERDRVWEEGAKEGGPQMLARMAEYVAGMKS